jgi:hypothetical protein
MKAIKKVLILSLLVSIPGLSAWADETPVGSCDQVNVEMKAKVAEPTAVVSSVPEGSTAGSANANVAPK